MKKLMLGMLVSAPLTFTQAIAGESVDTIYVGGQSSRLTMNQMEMNTQGGYTAYIDMEGDIGNLLIFDIDAKVSGRGHNQHQITVETDYSTPWNPIRRSIVPTGMFYYEIEVAISCNGKAIAYGKKNLNEQHRRGKLVLEKNRTLEFLLDNERKMGGTCQQIKVEVNPIQVADLYRDGVQKEKTVLYAISLDIHVLEKF